ncbi:ribosome maturation factor RimM [Fructobacillus sp. M1-13]|uniref:Ribosome maturation factor RimM n=1 Tax=Fructobacillus papyriferae TaxID=2713171 RepID=A0ABS5QN53_9LACO|nr:ribosome maturation factor RimM [Fructobacillus papyriferae]MBS9334513.1 ribosome maturation factor RimM [Fructobacillus papyriferae]MCD2158502.1 ribosome maturation factor RimM [Fructobacillus papyriferae]
METVNFFKIGTIVNTHGIKGELKVKAITDFADERFAKGATVYRLVDGDYLKETVEKARLHKGMWLVTFAGVTNINEVEAYKGQELYVAEEDRNDLDDGEYYYSDIIGCTVQDVDGKIIGTVKEIMETGANDVWIVKRQQGADALIPVILDVVKEVNVADQMITIDVLEGLLD